MGSRYCNDLVSIITPAYNCEEYLKETIESVLQQTYPHWEMIIINDCSEDSTNEIAGAYARQDDRIKLINFPKNSGVAKARNIGVQSASGRYIAFLDSDDLWLPMKLETQVQFMQTKGAAFSYAQYRQFIGDVHNTGKLIDVHNEIKYKDLLKGNIIGCLTVIIDRNYIEEIIMPKERHEDYITWLKILKHGVTAHGLKEDVARYRKLRASLSGNKAKSALWTWRVYRDIEKLSLVRSFYYFSCYMIRGIKKHASVGGWLG